MSLLKITTTPIEYEIKIERAKLQAKEQDFNEIKRQQSEQARKQRLSEYKTDPSSVKAIEQSSKNTMDYQNVARVRSASRVRSTPTAQLSGNSSVGSLTSAVSENFSDAVGRIDFVSGGNGVSFDEAQFVNSVNMSGMVSSDSQWTVSKKEMEYVPGRFQMDIIQYPKVTIEYLGNNPKE